MKYFFSAEINDFVLAEKSISLFASPHYTTTNVCVPKVEYDILEYSCNIFFVFFSSLERTQFYDSEQINDANQSKPNT